MLEKFLTKKNLIKIYREVRNGEANIDAFILKMSKDFMLLQNEEEFNLNGYTIIRKDHYDAIRCSKIEKTLKRILKGEGIIKKHYGLKKKLSLESWESIFRDLKKHGYHVIVECEDMKKPLFTIGEIIKVRAKTVAIHNYNAEGILDKKPTVIKFKHITLLRFGDHYSATYRKYLSKKK